LNVKTLRLATEGPDFKGDIQWKTGNTDRGMTVHHGGLTKEQNQFLDADSIGIQRAEQRQTDLF